MSRPRGNRASWLCPTANRRFQIPSNSVTSGVRKPTGMTSTQIAVISIAVMAIIAVAIVLFLRSRTKKLRPQLGPESNRAVEGTGSRDEAGEAEEQEPLRARAAGRF